MLNLVLGCRHLIAHKIMDMGHGAHWSLQSNEEKGLLKPEQHHLD